jgi:hypothetical protein
MTMARRSLLWRIYLSFLTGTLVALVTTAWYAARALRTFHEEQVRETLRVRARLLAGFLAA